MLVCRLSTGYTCTLSHILACVCIYYKLTTSTFYVTSIDPTYQAWDPCTRVWQAATVLDSSAFQADQATNIRYGLRIGSTGIHRTYPLTVSWNILKVAKEKQNDFHSCSPLVLLCFRLLPFFLNWHVSLDGELTRPGALLSLPSQLSYSTQLPRYDSLHGTFGIHSLWVIPTNQQRNDRLYLSSSSLSSLVTTSYQLQEVVSWYCPASCCSAISIMIFASTNTRVIMQP